MLEKLRQYAAEVEAALDRYLPAQDDSRARIREAMRYSLLSPGKRIRSVLTLEFAHVTGGSREAAMPLACALEMIHCYSLIHDDLPCMDNDTLRRGRPTNHVVYGEDFAVLAGDGLLTQAFATALSAEELTAQQMLEACRVLAEAAGVDGMLGGQSIDVAHDGKLPSFEALCEMYGMKTGALIRASGRLGCIASGADETARAAADRYTKAVGMAFQIRDDLLDLKQDIEAGRTTYPAVVGEETARQRIESLTQDAEAAVSVFPDCGFLVDLAAYLAGREV